MSGPRAPDPYATAAAQTTQNVNTATANSIVGNANEISPYGSVRYNRTGTVRVGNQDVPQFERITTLSPEQQRLYDQQTNLGAGLNDLAIGQVGRLSDVLGQPIDTSALPAGGQAPTASRLARVGAAPDASSVSLQRQTSGDYEAARRSVEDAILSRVNPSLDRDRAALDARLRNNGLVPGSEAYNRAMDEANRAATDARYQAVLAGGQEQSRLAGLDQSRLGFNNSAAMQEAQFNDASRQQAYSNDIARIQANNAAQQIELSNAYQGADYANTTRERALQMMLAGRNQPINEISALMSGGQVTAPQFSQYRGGQVAGTDIADLINQDYKRRLAQNDAMLGGIAGIGKSLLMAPMSGGGSLFGNAMGGLMRGFSK